MMLRSLGDRRVTGTDDDLFHLLERLDGAPPALYLCCGTEDRLYPDSVAFRDACAARGVPLTAEFGPGGHEWDYWDAQIQSILDWLPLTR
jgi:putative tributyrin esterase